MNPNPPENPPISAASQRQSASWDVRNAPKNYVSLVLTQGASAVFSFASVWLLTKTLGSEDYGGVVAIIAASQIAQALINWSSVAVIRFGVDEFIETEKIARTFWLRLFILLPNLLLVWLAANFWFPPLAGWLKLPAGTFWLVFLHFAAMSVWIHIQFSLQAVKLPRLQGGLLTVERVLSFTILLVLLATNKLNSFSAILCYASIPLLMSLAGFLYLRKFVFSRFSVNREFLQKIFVYSVPLFPVTLIGHFSGGYIDAIFVSEFLSTRDLGVYSVALQINGMALQLPTLANSLLIPLFVSLQKENRTQRLKDYFTHVMPVLTLGWSFFCVLLAFAGYFLIPLIFGEEFAGAVTPFWILLTASGISLPYYIGYSALSHSISTTYISMFSVIFAALANVIFNFLLIPRFGVEGCAWATVIMCFVSILTFYVFLRRTRQIPLSWLFGAILPIFGAAIVFSLTRNPFSSTLVCAISSILIVFFKMNSLRETFNFLKSLRR